MRKFGVKEVFSDDWRQTIFWLAIALAALIVGFASGWAWRDRPESLARVRITELLTAIGTIGAVIVALWLGLRQSMRDEKIQKAKARGIAVVLTVKLDNASNSLSGLRRKVEQARFTAAGLRDRRKDCANSNSDNSEVEAPTANDPKIIDSEILDVVGALKNEFRTLLNNCSAIAGYEEIEALAFAPDDLSHRLAREVTHAEYILPSVETFWWVFTASCLGTVPGIEQNNNLETPLKKCEELAKKYRKLAADLDMFSKRQSS